MKTDIKKKEETEEQIKKRRKEKKEVASVMFHSTIPKTSRNLHLMTYSDRSK